MKEQFGGFIRTSSNIWDKKSDKSKYDKSIVFIEDTKQIYTNGVYYGSLEDESYIHIEYSQLISLKNSGELTPGATYNIIDYKDNVLSNQEYSEILSLNYLENEEHNIIVKALTNDALDCNARSISYIKDEDNQTKTSQVVCEVKLDFNNGIICWMKDEFCNEAPYDFKHVKFEGLYTFGTDVEDYSLNGFENSVYNNKIMKPVDSQYNRINFSKKNVYGNTIYPSVMNCAIDIPIKESLITMSELGLHVFDPTSFITPISVNSI